MSPNLPPELLAMIISFLDYHERRRYVTISRQWQLQIEPHAFRKIRLKSTDLQAFSDIFVGHRRALLADLRYDVVLPSYDDCQRARFERTKDKQANNEVLTEAIHGLFSVLASWNEAKDHKIATCQRRQHISFDLRAYSLTDVDERRDEDVLPETRDACDFEDRYSRFRLRYKHSFLQILRVGELPEVSQISDFQCYGLSWPRRIEGSSLAGVVAKLPNLETLEWTINDDEKRYPAVRQQHRFEFAQSLQHITLHHLRKIDLRVDTSNPHNEHLSLQSALLPSSPSVDHLSCALHVLSQLPRLVEFRLLDHTVFSPCFFWPDAAPSDNLPFWPNLRHLEVWLNDTTPDGEWLYLGDPNEAHNDESIGADVLAQLALEEDEAAHANDSEDSQAPDAFHVGLEHQIDGYEPEQYFRDMLDHKKINPMLMAMARAATCMPKLQRMALYTGKEPCGMEVTYLAAGQDINSPWKEGKVTEWSPGCGRGGDLLKKRWHLLLSPSTDWEVPYELECMWKEMGSRDDEVVILIDRVSYRATTL